MAECRQWSHAVRDHFALTAPRVADAYLRVCVALFPSLPPFPCACAYQLVPLGQRGRDVAAPVSEASLGRRPQTAAAGGVPCLLAPEVGQDFGDPALQYGAEFLRVDVQRGLGKVGQRERGGQVHAR
jgi:hypothetical protein